MPGGCCRPINAVAQGRGQPGDVWGSAGARVVTRYAGCRTPTVRGPVMSWRSGKGEPTGRARRLLAPHRRAARPRHRRSRATTRPRPRLDAPHRRLPLRAPAGRGRAAHRLGRPERVAPGRPHRRGRSVLHRTFEPRRSRHGPAAARSLPGEAQRRLVPEGRLRAALDLSDAVRELQLTGLRAVLGR